MAEQLYIGRKVRDSHDGGYGKISVGRVLKFRQHHFSSAVYDNYKDNPSAFVNRIENLIK
jgi:cell division protein FtsI (penicillin-binding protein 3)